MKSDLLASDILLRLIGYITIKVIKGNVKKHDKKTELFKIGIIPFSSTGCRFSILAFGETRIIAKINKIEAKYMNSSEARAIVSIPYNTAITIATTNIELIT